jgi:hypothetical protein
VSLVQPNSSPAQVPTNITAPNPQAPFLIPQTTLDPSSAPNPNQALMLNSNYDANPQKSLSDLMSEAVHSWPNQIQQGDQDLFQFPGFQDPSESGRMNNVDIGEDLFTGGLDVRFF